MGKFVLTLMLAGAIMMSQPRETHDEQKEVHADARYNLYIDERGQVGSGVSLDKGMVLTPDGRIKQSINTKQE